MAVLVTYKTCDSFISMNFNIVCLLFFSLLSAVSGTNGQSSRLFFFGEEEENDTKGISSFSFLSLSLLSLSIHWSSLVVVRHRTRRREREKKRRKRFRVKTFANYTHIRTHIYTLKEKVCTHTHVLSTLTEGEMTLRTSICPQLLLLIVFFFVSRCISYSTYFFSFISFS